MKPSRHRHEPHTRPWRVLTTVTSSLLLVFTGFGCVVANPNHCVNRDADGNAWCKAQDAERPFCNPCSGVNDGCQGTEPQLSNPRGEDYCFDYVSPGTTSGMPPMTDSDGDGDGSSGSDGDSSGSDSSDGDSGSDSSGGDSGNDSSDGDSGSDSSDGDSGSDSSGGDSGSDSSGGDSSGG